MHVIDAQFAQQLISTIGTFGGVTVIIGFGLAYISSASGRATSWGGNKKWW